jgi:hypothetical protein
VCRRATGNIFIVTTSGPHDHRKTPSTTSRVTTSHRRPPRLPGTRKAGSCRYRHKPHRASSANVRRLPCLAARAGRRARAVVCSRYRSQRSRGRYIALCRQYARADKFSGRPKTLKHRILRECRSSPPGRLRDQRARHGSHVSGLDIDWERRSSIGDGDPAIGA